MKFRGTRETPQEIGDMGRPSFVEGYWTLVIRNSVSFPGPATRDSVAKGGRDVSGGSINRSHSSPLGATPVCAQVVLPPPGVDYRKAIQLLEESTAPPGSPCSVFLVRRPFRLSTIILHAISLLSEGSARYIGDRGRDSERFWCFPSGLASGPGKAIRAAAFSGFGSGI
jgi:hypothetical protein